MEDAFRRLLQTSPANQKRSFGAHWHFWNIMLACVPPLFAWYALSKVDKESILKDLRKKREAVTIEATSAQRALLEKTEEKVSDIAIRLTLLQENTEILQKKVSELEVLRVQDSNEKK